MKFDENGKILQGARALLEHIPFDGKQPYQFTTPKDELSAAYETAWLGTYITLSGRVVVSGPDAVRLLNYACVNRDFGLLKVGSSRHALACDEDGYLVASGLIIRTGEDSFMVSNIDLALMGLVESGRYDVKIERSDEFIFQVDGIKSLQIIEKAFGCDFHDLKFAQNKKIDFNGQELIVHRLGMSGALAYEVHGLPEAAEDVYGSLLVAGQEFGMKRMGIRQYGCGGVHTPGGYPNHCIHFGWPALFKVMGWITNGSASDDIDNYSVNPFELKWDYLIDWNHDFIGKEALQRLAEQGHRTAVTLIWDAEDVGRVYAAGFTDPDLESEGIGDFNDLNPELSRIHIDKVMDGDAMVGLAEGRCIDWRTHKFISLGFVEQKYAEQGTAVEILWGEPGSNQYRIKATVTQYPYYDGEWRNETCDVNALVPRLQG